MMIIPPDRPLKVAILVCPGFLIMDVIGAHTVLGGSPNAELHFIWKNTEPLSAIPPLRTQATTTFADAPEDLDVLVVGAVPPEVVSDAEALAFLRRHHARGGYVIGVCVGVLLVGAAGLLEGKRATTNFHCLDRLPALGAIPMDGGRVVVEDRIYTAGPVTGGFEAALLLLAQLRGEEVARFVELAIEYEPHPPFGVGTPEKAGPTLTAKSRQAFSAYTTAAGDAAVLAFQRHAASKG